MATIGAKGLGSFDGLSSDTLHNLETERLILKAFNKNDPTDYARVIEMYNLPSLIAQIGKTGIDNPEALEKRRLSRIPDPSYHRGRVPLPENIWWLLYHKMTGDFVGITMISARKGMPLDPGYSIREHYWDQGYATESTRELLRFWRDDLGVKEFCIMTWSDNRASIRVAEKLGFVTGKQYPVVQDIGFTKEMQVMVLPGMKPFDPQEGFR